MKTMVAILFLGLMIAGFVFATEGESGEIELPVWQTTSKPVVKLTTEFGDIYIELFDDIAPIHTENFLKLTGEGFYDSLTFHRIIPGFMAQGGDPKGDGTGGPGYTLPAEISTLSHTPGMLAAARRGDAVNPKKESSGSQFYIMFKPAPHLDGEYTIFGQVIEGMDVVFELEKVELADPRMGRPKETIYILDAEVVNEGETTEEK